MRLSFAAISFFLHVIVDASMDLADANSANSTSCESGFEDAEDQAFIQLSGQTSQLPGCTSAGKDPWATGKELDCCEGLSRCLGEWMVEGSFSYVCGKSCDMKAYNAKFDTTPDHLKIAATAAGIRGNPGSISDNYYLVVGDQGGCAGGCWECCDTQRAIATKMIKYVAQKTEHNPNSKLLFVLVVGDNFYWTGASAGRFKSTWYDVYGPVLTGVPWFVILGNHDFGNDDPEMACPYINPRFSCNEDNKENPACGGPAPYSSGPQDYASNALNADKGGVDATVPNRKNWYQPDFFFYYTIPELNIELLGLDTNWFDREGMGGNGYRDSDGGAHLLARRCGGKAQVINTLRLLKDASFDLLEKRAAAAAAKNVAIFSHYPDWFQEGINLRKKFHDGLPQEKQSSTKILNFFGHTHVQQCNGYSADHECLDILTGGSGGCCSKQDTPAGFVVIGFDRDGYQKVDCLLEQDCLLNSYYGISGSVKYNATFAKLAMQDSCRHTNDNAMCKNYNGPPE